MKIIREPKVYLIGRQQIDGKVLQEFLEDHQAESWHRGATTGNSESLVEIAGRTCYMSFSKPRPGGNKTYIDHIMEVGHGSVIEHAVWNLLITGISRSLSHELVRHRAGISPSQLSQRYVDESIAEYIEPDIIAEDEELHKIWQEAIETTHKAYCELSKILFDKICKQRGYTVQPSANTEIRKESRQAARSVLPNATETKLFLTMNARACRNFLELRASRHADVEIRKLANQIYEVLVKEAPNLFSDYKKIELPDGTFELVTEWRKV